MNFRRKPLSVPVAVCVLAALAAGSVVLVVSHAAGGNKYRTAIAVARGTNWVSIAAGAQRSGPPARALVKHFAILRRARVSSAAVPEIAQDTLALQRYGLDGAEARAITLPDGRSGSFVPGSQGACLSLPSFTGCDPTATVLSGGLVGVIGGPTETVFGAAPDGASVTATEADGATVAVPVANNAFSASTAAGNRFTGLRVRLSSGATSTVDMPVGAP
jgi:hypothetical protein